MIWNSFQPTMLKGLMADSATSFRDKDIRRLKSDRQNDAMRDEERQGALSDRNAADMERRSEIDRGKRMEQIEGESGDQRMTRLQNQAWNPDAYGKKYRDQFKQQEQEPTGAGVDYEAEARRKRRLAMAMGSSDY